MLDLLWLVPTLPFASFLVLALAGRALPRNMVALLGVGSVGLSAVLAFAIANVIESTGFDDPFVRAAATGCRLQPHAWKGLVPGI